MAVGYSPSITGEVNRPWFRRRIQASGVELVEQVVSISYGVRLCRNAGTGLKSALLREICQYLVIGRSEFFIGAQFSLRFKSGRKRWSAPMQLAA